jgi:hypothetical protein
VGEGVDVPDVAGLAATGGFGLAGSSAAAWLTTVRSTAIKAKSDRRSPVDPGVVRVRSDIISRIPCSGCWVCLEPCRKGSIAFVYDQRFVSP